MKGLIYFRSDEHWGVMLWHLPSTNERDMYSPSLCWLGRCTTSCRLSRYEKLGGYAFAFDGIHSLRLGRGSKAIVYQRNNRHASSWGGCRSDSWWVAAIVNIDVDCIAHQHENDVVDACLEFLIPYEGTFLGIGAHITNGTGQTLTRTHVRE